MQKLKTSIYTALLASGLMGVPQLSAAASLLEAMQQAYQSNPSLRAKREKLHAVEQTPKAVFAQFLPQIVANASYSTAYPAKDANLSSFTAYASLNQNLFNGLRSFNSYSGAQMQVSSSQLDFVVDQQSFLLTVVQTYSAVYEARQLVALLEQSLKTLKEQLRSEQAQFAAGQGTKISVAQALSGVAQAEAALSQAKADLKSKEATYRQIIGVTPDRLDVPQLLLKIPASFTEVLQVAMEKHPAILSAHYAVKAAEYNVNAKKGAFSPSVDLNLSYNTARVAGANAWSPGSSTVKLSVNAPIFSGGALIAQLNEAKANLNAAKLQYDAVYAAIQQSLVSGWANLLGVKAAITADEANVKASTVASEGVKAQNRVGQATTLDVLLQHNNLIKAQIGLVKDQQRLLISSYSLLAAMGELKPELLGIVYDAVAAKPEPQAGETIDPWSGLR